MSFSERREVDRHLRALSTARVEGTLAAERRADRPCRGGIVMFSGEREPGRVDASALRSRRRRRARRASSGATAARAAAAAGGRAAARAAEQERAGVTGRTQRAIMLRPSAAAAVRHHARAGYRRSAAPSAQRAQRSSRALDASRASRCGTAWPTGAIRAAGKRAVGGIEHVADAAARAPTARIVSSGGAGAPRARPRDAPRRAGAALASARADGIRRARLPRPVPVGGEQARPRTRPKSISFELGQDQPGHVAAAERELRASPACGASSLATPRSIGSSASASRSASASSTPRSLRALARRHAADGVAHVRQRVRVTDEDQRSTSSGRDAFALQQHAAVVEHVPHADRLVQPDRRLRSRRARTGTRSARARAAGGSGRGGPARVALPAGGRIDPDLLQLHGLRRPRRRLGLERITRPRPTATSAPPRSAPACASESRSGRVRSGSTPSSSWCAAAHAGTSRSRSRERRRPQARLPPARAARRSRRRAGRGGPRAARGKLRRAASQSSPTAPCLADQHPRARPRREIRERAAAAARRDDVRAEVAERRRAPRRSAQRREPAVPPSGDVLEEDALDGILGAEAEDLARSTARSASRSRREL